MIEEDAIIWSCQGDRNAGFFIGYTGSIFPFTFSPFNATIISRKTDRELANGLRGGFAPRQLT